MSFDFGENACLQQQQQQQAESFPSPHITLSMFGKSIRSLFYWKKQAHLNILYRAKRHMNRKKIWYFCMKSTRLLPFSRNVEYDAVYKRETLTTNTASNCSQIKLSLQYFAIYHIVFIWIYRSLSFSSCIFAEYMKIFYFVESLPRIYTYHIQILLKLNLISCWCSKLFTMKVLYALCILLFSQCIHKIATTTRMKNELRGGCGWEYKAKRYKVMSPQTGRAGKGDWV